MAEPHLVLTGCIEAMKTALFYSYLVVAVAYKRYNRQYLDHGEYTTQRHTTHLYPGCGYKWDVTPQVQDNPLAALGCWLRENEL